MELVLGIDLGTHGARALVVDNQGQVYGQGRAAYSRTVKAGGIQEQLLQPVWLGLCSAVAQAVSGLANPDQVAGLAVTHQRGTVIALDKELQPLGPAMCDSDGRSLVQARWLANKIGPEWLYELTGCPPLAFNGLTKILWYHHERPQQAARVTLWASVQDWAVLRLTGQPVTSPGGALRLGIMDVRLGTGYAVELLAELGLDTSRFMPLLPFGQVLGYLQPSCSGLLNLKAGLPVFAAPGDQPAAVLGAGVIGRGDALVNLGTSFLTSFPLKEPAPARSGSLYTLELLPDGFYALELGSGAGTNILDWLRDSLFQLASDDEMNRLGNQSPPGANGVRVIPHWWTALGDQTTGAIQGLNSSHTRADIIRATLESLAYEVRRAWDQLSQAAGKPERAALCGGASNWTLLCQLLANVLACPTYRLGNPEASALGAAISAALGLGWYSTAEAATQAMAKSADSFNPCVEDVDFYRLGYASYRQLLESNTASVT